MTQTPKAVKADSFEKNLQRLDGIVRELEDADLPLEKALQLYEEGMRISEICHKQLKKRKGKWRSSQKKRAAR